MRYKLKKMLGMLIACSILISCWSVYVGHATADAGQDAYTFNYAYDCQRYPAYPSKGGTLHASGFTTPLDSSGSHAEPIYGNWKLVYLGLYSEVKNSISSSEIGSVVSDAANAYGMSSNDIPVYELKRDNTHYAYGVLVTLADNKNIAAFIGDTWGGGAGYVLSKYELNGSYDFNVNKDLKDITKRATADPAVVAVDDIIEDLPAPKSLTRDDAPAIAVAREKYDALDDGLKSQVDSENVSKLVAAESAIDTILNKEVDDVEVEINKLPTADQIKAADEESLNDIKGQIESVRGAYENLYDSHKGKVENYNNLLNAEVAYVENLIDKLPAPTDITLDDIDDIEAARSAYNALPAEGEQDLVKNDNRLEAAETAVVSKVDLMIASLPGTGNITTADAEEIKAARDAYNSLPDRLKDSVTKLTKLEAAEEALSNAEIAEVEDLIAALPALNEIKPSDAEAINAAREAYEALSAAQKGNVENYDDLVNAEKALIDAEIAAVEDLIASLPVSGSITVDDADDIKAARDAYEALTDAQKAEVSNLDALVNAEVELVEDIIDNLPESDAITSSDAEAIEAALNAFEKLTDDQKADVGNILDLVKAEAALVDGFINDLPAPDSVKLSDIDAIKGARDAYDSLDDDQKDLIKGLDDLEAAENALVAIVEDMIDDLLPVNNISIKDADRIEEAREAYNSLPDSLKGSVTNLEDLEDAEYALVKAEANVVELLIDAIPSGDEITVADADAIKAARDAYNALDDAKKPLVSNIDELASAENALVDAIEDSIDNFPGSDEISLSDSEAIKATRAAYEALPKALKDSFDEDYLDDLEAAEAALSKVEIADVEDKIDNLPVADKISTSDADAIKEAREAYDALTDEQKSSVDNLDELVAAEEALDVALEEEAVKVAQMIKRLPDADTITKEDYESVYEVKAIFDKLTDSQKSAIGAELAEKLEEDVRAVEIEWFAYGYTQANLLLENFGELMTAETKAALERSVKAAKDVMALGDKASVEEIVNATDKLLASAMYADEELSKIYKVIAGDGFDITEGALSEMVIKIKQCGLEDNAFENFISAGKKVYVDGIIVDSKNYTYEKGSLILTLLPDFLKTLSVGDHTLTVRFSDTESINVTFTVSEAAYLASTGEPVSYIGLTGAILVLLAGGTFYLRKRIFA
ncbi:hypothetical protein SAMN02910264_01869 [Ruminococcaceae bacterium YAD3003]|nr:hypothetical protein SAMN02910264_01869 [Ruminococcaceae bacterium YAD3003]